MEKTFENILRQYSEMSSYSLIAMLQDVQNISGYLSASQIQNISETLNIPVSKIYTIATFYNQFRFKPLGKYHFKVCHGTACHIISSLSVIQELERLLEVSVGETTRNGQFSLEVCACVGACSLAPVISVNGEYHSKVTTKKLKEIVEYYKSL